MLWHYESLFRLVEENAFSVKDGEDMYKANSRNDQKTNKQTSKQTIKLDEIPPYYITLVSECNHFILLLLLGL